MVFSRGLVISLGVSALSATLLFLYFRNRISSVEKKVDVMFDLIQSHQSDRQQAQHMMMQQQRQQNQAPSQDTGAWIAEDTEVGRNLIDVSEDDEDYDEEYDSEDSKEVSDNDDDLEERIKLVTTDIDIQVAEEAKAVEVLEANNTEPVSVDETIELKEVTDDLEDEEEEDEEEEELGSSADVENTVQSADKSDNNDDVDDSLEEDDSEEEEDNIDEPIQEVEKEVQYSKLKVAELKAIAEAMGLTNYKSLKKQPLIDLIKASE